VRQSLTAIYLNKKPKRVTYVQYIQGKKLKPKVEKKSKPGTVLNHFS
jgi:hypothetical protein